MRAIKKTARRKAPRRDVLTLTERVERLERHYFAQQPKPSGPRFRTLGDNIVHDVSTGLQWTRGNIGDKPLNWADAKKACEALTLGGNKDWRLPTIRELLTLVDYDRKDPAIDPVFRCDSSWYWTSTPAAASPSDDAWFVYFNSGGSDWLSQGYEFRVRAVRAGQIVGSLA